MTTYVYAHNRAWPVDHKLHTHPHGGCLVEPDTLVCYDVVQNTDEDDKPTRGWTFSVQGHEGIRYKTFYEWSLVPNNPENLERLKAFRNAQNQYKLQGLEVERLHAQVFNVQTENER